ncbi:RagB/SusD family nutrient uptake outer membrane protein [Bacteroides sp. AN502(2024)]
MKKNILSAALFVAVTGGMCISCADKLELFPIDYYGSGSYWKNEAHVIGYMDGIHKHLRDATFQHTFLWGEARGGNLRPAGTSADGMGMLYGDIKLQNFDEAHTGVSKFGDIFGRLTNINLFIARVTDATYISEAKKGYYLGQAYGLRAFYYFDLYRTYGGVPLRLTADVVEGVIDPNLLYLGRATPREVMVQIKKDLDKSLECFGDNNSFDPNNRGNKKGYWSKAATECLMGEVYLWTSKVTTGDDVADESNLAIAKQHLLYVLNNYGIERMDKFADVFEAKNNKGNKEVIFAIRYAEGEATNNNNLFTYAMATGSTKDRYKKDGEKFLDALNIGSTGSQQLEYKIELYNSFDDEDTRKDATFIASYNKDADTGELSLHGTHVCKNIGYVNSAGTRVYCGDYIIYRLPWVWLTLAEIENMQGGDVATYINKVRERAYGSNWDEEIYGYKNADFTTNELAILHEKDKEFVQEGQRWWDLRRMTLTKGGEHLVFCKEGSIGTDQPVLDKATETHKVLWPVDVTLLGNDPLIYQTPGYDTYKHQPE